MPKNFQTPINLNGLELLNARLQNLATVPASPTAGMIYYDTARGNARIYSGGTWVELTNGTVYTDEMAQDTVAALIAAGTHTGVTVTYDDTANTLSFTIGAGAISTGMLADSAVTNIKLADGSINNAKVASNAAISADKLADGVTNVVMTSTERTKLANISTDAAAGTGSLRTLGTGALQAAAGNDPRFSDARTPSAGSVMDSSVATNAAINADKIANGTTNKVYTATEQTKLAGIAAGATVNSTDAQLRDRSTHTGTQSADTITSGTTNKVYTATEQTKLAGIATGATNYTNANAQAIPLNTFAVPTGNVAMANFKITGLAEPTAATDAATKNYVDTYAQGLDYKNSVAVATTANVALTGEQTIDGVTTAGSRILVKNQTTAAQNGIYVTGTGAWTRATDADTTGELTAGTIVYVEGGTTNGQQQWVLTTTGTITVGTTAQTWSQFSGASTLSAGAGLTSTGNVFAVGAGTGITVNTDNVAIDTNVVARKYSTTIGDGAATSFTVTHNLGTRDVIAQVYTNGGSYDEVEVDILRASINTLTVTFAVAPASSAYRVVVQG